MPSDSAKRQSASLSASPSLAQWVRQSVGQAGREEGGRGRRGARRKEAAEEEEEEERIEHRGSMEAWRQEAICSRRRRACIHPSI
mmetsp:Transcript_3501/g.7741  ORF Transcript_3501/g.7741 Transcript_3501/m.7741 type:complete len:85 (-) Transcript_3501:48-302(-)